MFFVLAEGAGGPCQRILFGSSAVSESAGADIMMGKDMRVRDVNKVIQEVEQAMGVFEFGTDKKSGK
jgi:hypothetical protein